MYGWSAAEALGRVSPELFEAESIPPFSELRQILRERGAWQGEISHKRKDGSRILVSSHWALKRNADGSPAGFLEITRDITERKRLEEQLRETARMESLGLLAGGIAHDFNNLLVGVLGNAWLVLEYLRPETREHALLEQLIRSADRMSDLTRQLLAYAGKGRFLVRRVNLSEIVRQSATLLQAAVPANVTLQFSLAPVPEVEADVAQMQQVLANLIINAAEAIGERSGAVSVSTQVRDISDSMCATQLREFSVSPGRFVALRVSDTGCGMDAVTQARIFDPFFTTKFLGRGLGLSAVKGIVQSHGGALHLLSEPGSGSTFELFFPAARSRVSQTASG